MFKSRSMLMLIYDAEAEEMLVQQDDELNLESDMKFNYVICGLDMIVQQIRKCWKCSGKVAVQSIRWMQQGNVIIANMRCQCSHSWKWSSSPVSDRNECSKRGRKLYEANYDIVTTAVATGTGYWRFFAITEMMNMPSISPERYYNIVNSLVSPSIDTLYENQKRSVLNKLGSQVEEDKFVDLAGDGQYDSRGYCANVCRYTVQCIKTHLIIDFEVERKERGGKSAAMEKNTHLKTGDMEVVKMQDKYERVFIGWHFLQIQDCHLRSKYHSKWTAFIDLDERISTHRQRMIDLLRSIQNPAIGEVQMQLLSVIKDEDYPKEFVNLETLEQEMIFKKYNKTIGPSWQGQKAVVRSEKIGIMSIHSAIAKYPGIRTLQLEPHKVVVRHLRSTKYRIFGSDWHKKADENGNLPVIQNTPLPQNFSEDLHKAIVKRVLHVYDRIPMNCSLIPKELQKMLNHLDPCEQMWPSF